MCGIAGVVTFDQRHPPQPAGAVIRAMTRRVAHRGPDGEGCWQAPGVALGHRRLAIIDRGPDGAQPMTRGPLTITYNGELYNHHALRHQLASDGPFTSRTDTEVVLRAWARWGPASLERFDGMYAFAIWDARTRTVTLARDRLGIKPLYLHHHPTFLAFASEVPALLAHPAVPRTPNLAALHHQLLCGSTLDIDRTRTLLAGVEQLAPGTYATIDAATGHRHTTRYWNLPDTDPAVSPDADELAGLLADTVTGMLMGDVPVGVLLSGGLDSSVITALAARTRPVTALTTTHATEAAGDAWRTDLDHSHAVAAHLPGRVHHRLAGHDPAVTVDRIDAVCDLAAVADDVRHLDIAANYQALRQAGLVAVLNGQGADEVMAGYVNRPGFQATFVDVAAPTLDTMTRLPGAHQPAALTAEVLADRDTAHDQILDLHASLPGPPLERAHRLLAHSQIPRILQFEDHLSMAAGVELRVPYLDHRLVEWCFHQPFQHHIEPTTNLGKAHLRAVAHPLVPPAVLTRPKQPFPHPPAGPLLRQLHAIVADHRTDLANDPVVTHLFDLPADPTSLPRDTLWLVLWAWRWHHHLSHL